MSRKKVRWEHRQKEIRLEARKSQQGENPAGGGDQETRGGTEGVSQQNCKG